MNNLDGLGWRSITIASILLSGSITLNSCGSKSQVAEKAAGVAPASSSSAGEMDQLAGGTAKDQMSSVGTEVAKTQPAVTPQKPQLVKTAELSLRLESIDKAMVQLRQIVQSQQGDIYNFQDDRLPENGRNHQATLMLKVPSIALENTLAEIAKLGRVESQGIKSDDVSQQLVDTDARLKNLRQQEDLTRKIMDRSGSVKDILTVSKELAAIREQIERLDATVKNLRQQVAYSTINLKLEEAQSTLPIGDAFRVQVQETWKNSTHAAGSLGTNLALGLLWLIPFAPFIAIGCGGVYYLRQRRKRVAVVETPQIEE
jgi:archaellum component FlaC